MIAASTASTPPVRDHAQSEAAALARIDWAILLALLISKVALSVGLLRAGFTHISDDDYARVVIAQRFAHAPTLDPSLTSWLPAPFWWTGGWMLAFGRSLQTAQIVAVASSALSFAAIYWHGRRLGLQRAPLLAGAVLLGLTPWDAFTSAACVPEALCAHAVAIAMLDLCVGRASVAGAVALLLATLSRYEPWALAPVYAVLVRSPRGNRTVALAPLLGPLLWTGWNAHAHGSAMHFLDRVSTYQRIHDPSALTLRAKLLVYPAAMWRGFAEWFALLVGAAVLARYVPATRSALRGALGCAALAAYLLAGSLLGGAPTHHPERALLPLFGASCMLMAAMGSQAALQWRQVRSGYKAWTVAVCAFALAWWVGAGLPRLAAFPGQTPYEDRSSQLAAGRAAAAGEPRAHYTLTPCAYEHLAWIAAFGRPENTRELSRMAGSESGATMPSDPACPNVAQGE